jgi:hypothetical protein
LGEVVYRPFAASASARAIRARSSSSPIVNAGRLARRVGASTSLIASRKSATSWNDR